MRYSTLIVGRPNQSSRLVKEEQTYGAGSHRTAIACRGGRCSCRLPGHARRQASCCRLRRPSPADNPVLEKDGGDTTGIILRLKPLARDVALQELAGQLRIVGVLTKGKRATAAFSRTARL